MAGHATCLIALPYRATCPVSPRLLSCNAHGEDLALPPPLPLQYLSALHICVPNIVAGATFPSLGLVR